MRSSGIGGDGNGTDLEREINVLFCEGGLDWSAVRHPRVGGRGGGVAAGQVPAPRLLPLHERRHRGLQVTILPAPESRISGQISKKEHKKNLLVDSSGAIWREGVKYILVTKRKG